MEFKSCVRCFKRIRAVLAPQEPELCADCGDDANPEIGPCPRKLQTGRACCLGEEHDNCCCLGWFENSETGEIERCDECRIYDTDEDAAEAAAKEV